MLPHMASLFQGPRVLSHVHKEQWYVLKLYISEDEKIHGKKIYKCIYVYTFIKKSIVYSDMLNTEKIWIIHHSKYVQLDPTHKALNNVMSGLVNKIQFDKHYYWLSYTKTSINQQKRHE